MPAFCLLLAILNSADGARGAADLPPPSYERDIRPILARRCTVCHNAKKRENVELSGGLALDTREGVVAGTARTRVVVPGRAAESEIMRRLGDPDEERRMPLQDRPLPASERELIGRWIDAGAPRGLPLEAKV